MNKRTNANLQQDDKKALRKPSARLTPVQAPASLHTGTAGQQARILGLQQIVGNQAVQRYLADQGRDGAEAAVPNQAVTHPMLQRSLKGVIKGAGRRLKGAGQVALYLARLPQQWIAGKIAAIKDEKERAKAADLYDELQEAQTNGDAQRAQEIAAELEDLPSFMVNI